MHNTCNFSCTFWHFRKILVVTHSDVGLCIFPQPELRGSLVLSILNQMLAEDKAESVRQAVCRSLAVLVAFTDDDGKFKQVRVHHMEHVVHE